MYPKFFPESYRDTEQEEYRFSYTDIMDGLPRFHFIHKLMQDGKQQPLGIAKGDFVPRNWKESREREKEAIPFEENKADVMEKRRILVGLKQLEQNTKRLTPRKVRKEMPRLKTIANDDIQILLEGISEKETVDDVRRMPKNEVRFVWGDKETDNPYDDEELTEAEENNEQEFVDLTTGEISESQVKEYTELRNQEIRAKQELMDETEDISHEEQSTETTSTKEVNEETKEDLKVKSVKKKEKDKSKEKHVSDPLASEDDFFDGGESDDIDLYDM